MCPCKESKHERFSVCGGYPTKGFQLEGWKHHQVLFKAISQLVTERKEKIHKAGLDRLQHSIGTERDQVVQLIGEKCFLNCKMN